MLIVHYELSDYIVSSIQYNYIIIYIAVPIMQVHFKLSNLLSVYSTSSSCVNHVYAVDQEKLLMSLHHKTTNRSKTQPCIAS